MATGHCYIHGIGVAVPPYPLAQSASPELFRPACADPRTYTLLRRVTRRTGIERRHLAALRYQQPDLDGQTLYRSHEQQPAGPGMAARNARFDENAAPLVLEALTAFDEVALARVDALITVSCTHAGAPGIERPIQTATPVPASVDRWHLGFMGCSAGLAGLRLARQLSSAGRRALVVTCELSSLHFQYGDRVDQLTANALFADGAAAVLTSTTAREARCNVRVLACRSISLPAAADQMAWFAGDHGLRLELAQELPDTIGVSLPSALANFLREAGVQHGAIAHWVVHPGGPQILDRVEQVLGLSPQALAGSRDVLRRYGNMSSSTTLFILRELMHTAPRGLCVAMAFGPGLTIELALLSFE